MLAHGNFTIPGTHEDLKLGPWDRRRQVNTMFGLAGASVLQGLRVMRQITIPIWIHNNYNSGSTLQTFLDSLDARAGTVDTLHETGNITRNFNETQFDLFDFQRGPIPSNEIGWFAIGLLVFTQLKP